MPDPQYFVVLTEAGSALEAAALASGKGLVISKIAVGDANRQEVTPSAKVAQLVHEVCRRPIDSRSVDANDPAITLVHATIPADLGGFWIYELGVLAHLEGETDEILYAYGNHAPYYKLLPQAGQLVTHELQIPIIQKTDARLIIELSDAAYVTRSEFFKPKRLSWLLEEDVEANGTFDLPNGLNYFVGESRIELFWLGLRLAKGRNWQEAGEAGALSTQLKLYFAASAGDEMQIEIFG